ncbi:hypothetical protein C8E01_10452 [Pontibacter virosus]|uniref:Outer membrane beta-barrel porin/alpha-amylase n=2 Tax=Pontibacter virosus TaxID=1765052 RepID=A0A2U1AZB6_9BACT|nr:hypothetical protein C8E01_10452 [Pontibacter virosus]
MLQRIVFPVRALCLSPLALLFISFATWAKPVASGLAISDTTAATADSAVVQKNKLVLTATLGNRMSFLGRTSAAKTPFVFTDLTYKTKQGLWLAAATYQVFGSGSTIDQAELAAGVDFTVAKKVTNSLNYTKFFFASDSVLVNASTSNMLSASSSLDWQYVYSSLTYGYIFGQSNDHLLILSNSRCMPLTALLPSIKGLYIEPKVSIAAGTQHFATTYSQTVNNPVKGGAGPGKKPPIGGGGTTTKTTTTTSSTGLQIMNYEFNLALLYLRGRFTFEPYARYAVPVNLLPDDTSKASPFFGSHLYYTF